jgi:hypothetical protein
MDASVRTAQVAGAVGAGVGLAGVRVAGAGVCVAGVRVAGAEVCAAAAVAGEAEGELGDELGDKLGDTRIAVDVDGAALGGVDATQPPMSEANNATVTRRAAGYRGRDLMFFQTTERPRTFDLRRRIRTGPFRPGASAWSAASTPIRRSRASASNSRRRALPAAAHSRLSRISPPPRRGSPPRRRDASRSSSIAGRGRSSARSSPPPRQPKRSTRRSWRSAPARRWTSSRSPYTRSRRRHASWATCSPRWSPISGPCASQDARSEGLSPGETTDRHDDDPRRQQLASPGPPRLRDLAADHGARLRRGEPGPTPVQPAVTTGTAKGPVGPSVRPVLVLALTYDIHAG